jgi:hypothetical protein
MKPTTLASAFLALSLVACSASAANLPAEQRLESEFARGDKPQGEVIELQAGGEGFAAIHQPHAQTERRGAILLLHDRSSNADSIEVIRPLRLGLAAAGWDTLSVQLPVAYPGESRSVWLDRASAIEARLKAGLDWLTARAMQPRAVIAVGDSGPLLVQYASAEPPDRVRALVLISTRIEADDAVGNLATLGKLQQPLLDVFAERDTAAVRENAAARRQAATAGRIPAYRQITVPGALPGYAGLDDSLVASVRAWLAANAAGDAREQTPRP